MATSPSPRAFSDGDQSEAGSEDGRNESENERLDRNWSEILQELRVIQTGTQIITGFLLTLAFQQRFFDLDAFQVSTYLVLVLLAGFTTALALAPVSLHRALFRQRAKDQLVRIANRLLKVVLVGVTAVLAGTVLLIFDVVVSREAGVLAGTAMLVVAVALGIVLPIAARRFRDTGVAE
ncbi:MAG: sodium:proton antiporter [Microbacteriaceae bacterium]|jgi:hypothetical protein|nr:sodium:proton antiporter [Microbacteriaceae bacterium]HEV7956932.1 DUF6328 family protein [Marisediminicola sp.]